MTVSTGDILRVVASMLWTDGEINQNVFNAKVTGAGGPWDDEDIADDAGAWLVNMYANMTTFCSDELDGNEVIVYKYDPVGDDWDEVFSQAWIWNPTGVDDQQARGVAGLVRMWTEDPDVQGKKYFPGITEGNMTDGLFAGATVTALLAFGADWLTPFVGGTSGATWTPGVWSVAGTIFKAAVDHIASSTIPAYQRRRKNNVGI